MVWDTLTQNVVYNLTSIYWGLNQSYLPLMPTDGAPAATAAKAYSICTNFPEGLKNTVSDYCLMSNEEFFSYIMP